MLYLYIRSSQAFYISIKKYLQRHATQQTSFLQVKRGVWLSHMNGLINQHFQFPRTYKMKIEMGCRILTTFFNFETFYNLITIHMS